MSNRFTTRPNSDTFTAVMQFDLTDVESAVMEYWVTVKDRDNGVWVLTFDDSDVIIPVAEADVGEVLRRLGGGER